MNSNQTLIKNQCKESDFYTDFKSWTDSAEQMSMGREVQRMGGGCHSKSSISSISSVLILPSAALKA